jgi:hypothetical protein
VLLAGALATFFFASWFAASDFLASLRASLFAASDFFARCWASLLTASDFLTRGDLGARFALAAATVVQSEQAIQKFEAEPLAAQNDAHEERTENCFAVH